jgi:hypothetical protein
MGIPAALYNDVSHLALMLLVACVWVCSRQKRDLEHTLASTCRAVLDQENDVKMRRDEILALMVENEGLSKSSTVLNQRNKELQVRMVEAEAALRRGSLEFEGMCAKEKEAKDTVVSLSRAIAEQVLTISDLKAKLNAAEIEKSSWAHQIHLLIQDKEDLVVRSQKRQQKVLELQDKLSECYARLNRRCTYDGTKTPFGLWGSPLTVAYDDAGRKSSHDGPQNPSYSAPTHSLLK